MYKSVLKGWRRSGYPFRTYREKTRGAKNSPPPSRARDKIAQLTQVTPRFVSSYSQLIRRECKQGIFLRIFTTSQITCRAHGRWKRHVTFESALPHSWNSSDSFHWWLFFHHEISTTDFYIIAFTVRLNKTNIVSLSSQIIKNLVGHVFFVVSNVSYLSDVLIPQMIWWYGSPAAGPWLWRPRCAALCVYLLILPVREALVP